jgi:hypothetical protein
MAQTKLDDNFREELKAIEQWFSVLTDPERTTALYSLLQHTTPVQIRFLITVLQQMASKDPSNILITAPSGSTSSVALASPAQSPHQPSLQTGLASPISSKSIGMLFFLYPFQKVCKSTNTFNSFLAVPFWTQILDQT